MKKGLLALLKCLERYKSDRGVLVLPCVGQLMSHHKSHISFFLKVELEGPQRYLARSMHGDATVASNSPIHVHLALASLPKP